MIRIRMMNTMAKEEVEWRGRRRKRRRGGGGGGGGEVEEEGR